MTTLILDGQRIRARRQELGISERQLAARLGAGASQAIVRGIERGLDQAAITVGEVARLARVLALDVSELLLPATTAPPDGPNTQEQFLDQAVKRVGVILFELPRLVPLQTLAAALELTLDETEQAVGRLDLVVRPAGLRVHRLFDQVGLRPVASAVPAAQLEAACRADLARRGLSITQSLLLRDIVAGRRTRQLTNAQTVAAGELANAGILTRLPSGGVELSDEARFSLLLDEGPTAP